MLKKVTEITAKSLITPSKLPSSDFVINPYVGCMHACAYCYAGFMQRFTNHDERWGEFVDVKCNAGALMERETAATAMVATGATTAVAARRGGAKYQGKVITISSVTDPSQAIEKKYKLMRSILEKLIPLPIELFIITKSDLVMRDIDLLQQCKNCTVAISLTFLDDAARKILEPHAAPVSARIAALQALHQAKIKTALFISPIMPKLTPWVDLIAATRAFVDEYWFENLNLYSHVSYKVKVALDAIDKNLWDEYKKIYYGNMKNSFWRNEELQIVEYCRENNIISKIFFHH